LQLKGDAIPINARVFAIADVFDAMTTERPYKPEYSLEDTMGHMRKGSATHFDPVLLGVFEGIADGLHSTMQQLSATELESQIVEILREYFGLDPRGRYIGPWLKATIGDSK
jgi:HD-GYP domain-containing protein (c-di-GMP phosphodiesterase class II)